MIDTMQEIEILENVIIALQEGASDEKRMAITDLERMMQRKQVEVAEYDAWVDEQAAIQAWMEGTQI
jgi:hypothetical protein